MFLAGVRFEELRESFGEELFGLCFEENERVLRAVGSNLQDFFNSFDALLEHLRASCGRRVSAESPSFLCKDAPEEGGLLLHYFHPTPVVGLAMPGLVRAAARRIYHMEVEVEEAKPAGDATHPGNASSSSSSTTTCPSSSSYLSSSSCLSFLIKVSRSSAGPKPLPLKLSCSPPDLRIGLSTFCRAFPFHLVLDPGMAILQLGEGLRKQAKCEPHRTLNFRDCFEIVSPRIACSFQAILLRLYTPFTIRTRPDNTGLDTKEKVSEGPVFLFISLLFSLLFPCVFMHPRVSLYGMDPHWRWFNWRA